MSVSELRATRSHEEEAGVSSGLHEVELSSTEKLQRRRAAIFSLGIPSSIFQAVPRECLSVTAPFCGPAPAPLCQSTFPEDSRRDESPQV